MLTAAFPLVQWAFACTAAKGCSMQEQSHRLGSSKAEHFDFCFTSTTQPPTGIILRLPPPCQVFPPTISRHGPALYLYVSSSCFPFTLSQMPSLLPSSISFSFCLWLPRSYQWSSFFSLLSFILCWQLLSCLGILVSSGNHNF